MYLVDIYKTQVLWRWILSNSKYQEFVCKDLNQSGLAFYNYRAFEMRILTFLITCSKETSNRWAKNLRNILAKTFLTLTFNMLGKLLERLWYIYMQKYFRRDQSVSSFHLVLVYIFTFDFTVSYVGILLIDMFTGLIGSQIMNTEYSWNEFWKC